MIFFFFYCGRFLQWLCVHGDRFRQRFSVHDDRFLPWVPMTLCARMASSGCMLLRFFMVGVVGVVGVIDGVGAVDVFGVIDVNAYRL